MERLPQFVPIGPTGAVLALAVVTLAGFAHVARVADAPPPDGFAFHLLIRSPPFIVAITLPVIPLPWVLLTHRRA